MDTRTASLLTEIEAFLTETQMSPSYFGKRAVGNSELVVRLRAGTTPAGKGVIVRPETAAKLRDFIRRERVKRSVRAPQAEDAA